MGPVGLPEATGAMAKELWTALLARDDWADADLRGACPRTPLVRVAAAMPRRRRASTVTEDRDQTGSRRSSPLPRGVGGLLAGLPSKYRHEIKRKATKLDEEAGAFRIVTADDETLVPMLDRFVELHRMAEGPKGVFMVPGMEIFFRRLGEAFCADGVFRLTFIEVGGQLAAGTIGFVWGGTSYLYNSAFDRSWGDLAPGMVLVGEDIRLAIEEGCDGVRPAEGRLRVQVPVRVAVPRAVKRLVVMR